MGLKRWFLKKTMKRKAPGMSDEQQDKVLDVVENNQELFQKMQKEIDERTKRGEDETMAQMAVAKKYQPEIQKLMQK